MESGNIKELETVLEALLFMSGDALAVKEIAGKLEKTEKEVFEAATNLKDKYDDECGINILIFNNKLQFSTNPKVAGSVEKVLNPIKDRILSNAMLEVITIIAYKQPITRLEIEEIRGVSSDYALQVLTKHNLIEVVGRKDAVGKPVLFGTTDEFLKRFGISALSDLPDADELFASLEVVKTKEVDLYHRDEYAANAIDIDINVEEDLPDFLKGEKLQVVSSESITEISAEQKHLQEAKTSIAQLNEYKEAIEETLKEKQDTI